MVESRDREVDVHSRKERTRRYSRSRSPRSRSRHRDSREVDDVIPLHKRKRKLEMWDKTAVGFEGISAKNLKDIGIVPHPTEVVQETIFYHDRIRNILTPELATMIKSNVPIQTTLSSISGNNTSAGSQQSQLDSRYQNINPLTLKNAKKLYVGNVVFGTSEVALMSYFNSVIKEYSLNTSPGDPIIACQVHHDKNYAFLEFRSPEEATNCLAFDGIVMDARPLKVGRPSNYAPIPGIPQHPPRVNLPSGLIQSTTVPDTPNKIFIGGLPSFASDQHVMEILSAFGPLKAFNLVKDPLSSSSRGYAFCEFEDPALTDIVCEALNGFDFGDKKLVVQRADTGKAGTESLRTNMQAMLDAQGEAEPTRILQLMNMVTREELENEQEYADIQDDVMDECSKFGKVLSVQIPRPSATAEIPGVGKIFVEYTEVEDAKKAAQALSGRKFAERTVIAGYITEEQFKANDF